MRMLAYYWYGAGSLCFLAGTITVLVQQGWK